MSYEQYIINSNGAFTKDDLWVGKRLADGCYDKHRGHAFTIHSLRQSDVSGNENMYTLENTTKKDFWDKVHNFTQQHEKDYLDALHAFCSYLGIE